MIPRSQEGGFVSIDDFVGNCGREELMQLRQSFSVNSGEVFVWSWVLGR